MAPDNDYLSRWFDGLDGIGHVMYGLPAGLMTAVMLVLGVDS